MPRRSTALRVLVAGPTFRPWDLGTYLQDILKRRGVVSRPFAYRAPTSDDEASEMLVAAARAFRANVLLGLKLERIDPQALQQLRRAGVFVALWSVDCFDGRVPAWVASQLPAVDLFLTTARGMIGRYQALTSAPVRWVVEGVHLPAFPPLRLAPEMRAAYGSEVAFVGNVLHPPVRDTALARHRLRVLRRIAERHRLKVWGPQGHARTARAWRDVPAPLIPWPAYNAELVKVCQASDIVLGLNTINTVELYFSNRTFLTLASGGFHLTHYVPGLEAMFENHRHLVWFDSDDECLSLIDHYLRRPRERQAIAREGRRWTRRRYGMTRQLSRILAMIEACRGE